MMMLNEYGYETYHHNYQLTDRCSAGIVLIGLVLIAILCIVVFFAQPIDGSKLSNDPKERKTQLEAYSQKQTVSIFCLLIAAVLGFSGFMWLDHIKRRERIIGNLEYVFGKDYGMVLAEKLGKPGKYWQDIIL